MEDRIAVNAEGAVPHRTVHSKPHAPSVCMRGCRRYVRNVAPQDMLVEGERLGCAWRRDVDDTTIVASSPATTAPTCRSPRRSSAVAQWNGGAIGQPRPRLTFGRVRLDMRLRCSPTGAVCSPVLKPLGLSMLSAGAVGSSPSVEGAAFDRLRQGQRRW